LTGRVQAVQPDVIADRMHAMRFDAKIDNPNGTSRVVLVCEHASNLFPPEFGPLGLDARAQVAHVAWDIGALALAQALSVRLDAVLVHAPVSRLIYDLNRPPQAPGAVPARSEVFDIPGNTALPPTDRAARVAAIYLPFHNVLQNVVVNRLATTGVPALISVHSFTPVYHGQPRALEFGVIHDGDATLARGILGQVQGLRAALNEPYSAADGVTHLMRLHALPYDLPHAMLEIRNDLIADDAGVTTIADRLAPAIATAVGAL
jgi:predicted N-formylglutamate amidohydrolase